MVEKQQKQLCSALSPSQGGDRSIVEFNSIDDFRGVSILAASVRISYDANGHSGERLNAHPRERYNSPFALVVDHPHSSTFSEFQRKIHKLHRFRLYFKMQAAWTFSDDLANLLLRKDSWFLGEQSVPYEESDE